jgi:hypothetical protein
LFMILWANKLDHLYLVKFAGASLTLSPLGQAVALPTNIKID